MRRARIAQAVRAFADAACRAQNSGFDLVEIHAADGYLISQFLAPLENRARIGLDIVRAIKAAAPGLAVTFRLNGPDFFEGGMPLKEARQVAVWAADAGADAIHMSGGDYRSQPSAGIMIPPMATPERPFLHYAEEVKKRVAVPVIAVGRLGDPQRAIDAVEHGRAAFVALGRPLLADPEWAAKAQRGTRVS